MKIALLLHKTLIAPRQRDEDVRNREIVLNVLLSGTLFILLLTLVLLVIKIIFMGASFLETRAAAIFAVTVLAGSLYIFSRKGWHRLTSSLLVGLYFFVATILVWQWGINIPTGILLYGLVIVLAGILLGPAYALYAAGATITTITLVQFGAQKGLIHTDWSWTTNRPGMTDVFGYAFIFGTIALVTWLFNQQMARSLHKAELAESALTKQKELLEITVEERTQELQAAQLEKIQQMYRFAELGQLSTALLHDLANHLTTLTLNIESLGGANRSRVLAQAKRSIHHIDDMVVRVRDQLHGRANVRTFNVAHEIEEIVKMLRHRGQMANVQLNWQSPTDKKTLRCRGEPIRFRQMMANLITNGFDAYYERTDPDERREVLITAHVQKNNIVIVVNDWGRGIPSEERSKLFEPFHSTKQTGMGMGLFIVKQIAEEHFLGSAAIDTTKKHTAFVITLPKATL